jgi:hypothetical protein
MEGMDPARCTGVPNYIRCSKPWLATAAALALASCGGSDLTLPSDSVAAKIVIVSGDPQTATVGGTLPEKLIVRVTDTKDRPVQDQQVTFTPGSANSGTAVPPTATTDADGRAGINWVLGGVAGAQSMVAKPTGNSAPANLSVTFNATAKTSTPAKLEKLSGDKQNASAGTEVVVPPSVKVTDATGNLVVGQLVTFAVASGGGSITPTTPVPTNATGVAALATWTLGATAGPNSVTATIVGNGIAGNPATFTATGLVGSSRKLAFTVNPGATTAGAIITPAVQVQVQDATGNPIAGATNSITLDLGKNPTGASLGGTRTVSAVNGTATFSNLTVSRSGTGYTLTARGSGLIDGESAAFDVSAATPTQIVSNSAQSQTAPAGSNVPAPPSVIVKDAGGSGVPNVDVAFTVTSGGGSTTPGTVTTNGSGVATLTSWTLGSTPGPNQVAASVAGVPGSVDFNATGLAALAISTPSPLPNGEVGINYAGGSLAVAGGTAPFNWTLDGGNLPAGLGLNHNTGAITGTPNAPGVGTASFIVRVTDALNASATKAFSLTIVPSVQITTTSLPGGSVGTSYSQAVAVGGGQAPFTFSKPGGGALPPGPSLNTSTGEISGTPTLIGNYSFTIRVTDALGASDNQPLSIAIALATSNTSLTLNTSPSVFGQAVTFTARVTGSVGMPTGTVTFKEGGTCASGTVLDTQELSGGTATSGPISALPVGSHSILACYGGSSTFGPSSDNATQSVGPAPTSTQITITDGSPGVITVSFSVTASAPGSGTPSGTVTVSALDEVGTTTSCVASTPGANSCQIIFSSPSGTSEQVSASFAPDNGNFADSFSASQPHAVP